MTTDMFEKLAEEQEAEEAFKQDLEQAKKSDTADKSGESKKAKKLEDDRAQVIETQKKTVVEVKVKLAEIEEEVLKTVSMTKKGSVTLVQTEEKIELFKDYNTDREWW